MTKDIPQDATVAGNYAKVLNYKNPARYICNQWNHLGSGTNENNLGSGTRRKNENNY